MATFEFALLYRQLYVYDSALPDPYNDWTAAHVEQGFAYRPVSVAFSVLEEESYQVNILTANFVILPPDALFAVRVSLRADSGQICVGGIADDTVAYEDSLWWTVIFIERAKMQVDLYLLPANEDSGAQILKAHVTRPRVSSLGLFAVPART